MRKFIAIVLLVLAVPAGAQERSITPTLSIPGAMIEQSSDLTDAKKNQRTTIQDLPESGQPFVSSAVFDPQIQGAPPTTHTAPNHHYLRTFLIVFAISAVVTIILAAAAKK